MSGSPGQSKALLKLGVALDLGTAVKTSCGGDGSPNPAAAAKKKKTKNLSDPSQKLLQDYKDYKAHARAVPQLSVKQLEKKQLEKILAEKLRREIERKAAAKPAKRSLPPHVLAQPQAPARGGSRQPTAAGLERGGTAASVGRVGTGLSVASSRPETCRTGTAATSDGEERNGDAGDEEGTRTREGTAAASRASTAATAPGTAAAASASPATATATGAKAAGQQPGLASAKTADKSSEIDIVNLDEEGREWAQAKPMVLNLEDLGESTIEVLEYESERPLEV